MTREEALRKQGELYALRHLINLSSDLLDTPDFYWDNEDLEKIFLQTVNYFCIGRRTRVRIIPLHYFYFADLFSKSSITSFQVSLSLSSFLFSFVCVCVCLALF